MNDEPYASSVKAMLEKLGLPLPKPEEIFRGTHHDMLFLNSHGVVVRIGLTDVEDMLNPAIIQPLGWLEDRNIRVGKTPLSVVIYPGIEHRKNWKSSKNRPKKVGSLVGILEETGQETDDLVSSKNKGIIRILNDKGKEAAVEVVLDADNEFNGSIGSLTSRRSRSLKRAAKLHENKGDILSQTIESVFGATKKIKYWRRAFEAHQPLRRLFWEALSSNGVPNAKALQRFWDTCAQVTNNPQGTVVPVWRSQMKANGKTKFVRKEIFIPQVVLYRPWTGKTADKAVHPVLDCSALRRTLKKNHAALTRKKGLKKKLSL